MGLLAAFLISLPFVWLPIVVGFLGLVIWALLFVPALLGIALVQRPVKNWALSDGRSRAQTVAVVTFANVVFTIVLAYGVVALNGLPFPMIAVPILSAAALIAATIWTVLDDKALHGAARNTQGSQNA